MIGEGARVMYLLASLWSSPAYWRHRRESRQINRFIAEYAKRGGRAEVKLYFHG